MMASSAEEPSDKELLADVRRAIRSILLNGQSYSVGGRSFTKADLEKLYTMKHHLEEELRRQNHNYHGFNSVDFSGEGDYPCSRS